VTGASLRPAGFGTRPGSVRGRGERVGGEDEGRTVGFRAAPLLWWAKMLTGLVIVDLEL
jgi:hypothetical protein